jgi:hypothetical protein
MVSRYRIVSAAAVPEADGFGLVNAAICTGQTSSRATSVSGRASTDVRVWGPASSGARFFSVTLAAVTDRPPRPEGASGTDLPYRTAMRAAGVAPSRGALSGGVRAAQTVGDDDGSGTVMTTGTVLRTVPPGRFVSMRSAYAYTADLTRRISVTDEPQTPGITIESRTAQGGSCAPQPQQVGAGEYQVAFVALDGPASVLIRDRTGAVVLERAAVRQEVPPGEGGGGGSGGQPVWGVSEPAAVMLSDGDYTVECHGRVPTRCGPRQDGHAEGRPSGAGGARELTDVTQDERARSRSTGSGVVTAVHTVEAQVRELVRRRGLDPFADQVAIRRLVDEVVTGFDERPRSAPPPTGRPGVVRVPKRVRAR